MTPDVRRARAAERAARFRARRASGAAPRGSQLDGEAGRAALPGGTGQFIAIDGEGVSEGAAQVFGQVEQGAKTVYTGSPHFMMMLGASTGAYVAVEHGRLSFLQCVDFLFELKRENPRAKFVGYAHSYDCNQAMLYDLSREQLRAISRGDRTDVTVEGRRFSIQFRPRKSFWIKEYFRDARPDVSVMWYDVIGFFQQSYVATVAQWLSPDHPDLALMRGMKARRGLFTRAELPDMVRYNLAECTSLVAVMDLFQSCVDHLDLMLTRYDGAGALSAALLTKHKIKLHRGVTPDAVFMAARHAFSGGHIETMKVGVSLRALYHYDVNSAYPAIIAGLPDLARGTWEFGAGDLPPAGAFGMVLCSFAFASGRPFYPLFFRHPTGRISYPADGAGWYWMPEYEAAREFADRFGGSIIIEAWHVFRPEQGVLRPFAFILDLYAKRQEMVRLDRAGELTPGTAWMRGGEKVLKLAANGSYGKLAQQVGSRNGEPPPFFQLCWAGFITSSVRAQLMRAGMQEPMSIVSFATDAVFSSKPLRLNCPAVKELGQWEFQRHDGMVIAMPGVYWLLDAGQVRGYSRGFDKATMADYSAVADAWRAGQRSIPVPVLRMVGMGSACVGNAPNGAMWRARGMFLHGTRSLDISGDNSKRHAPDTDPREFAARMVRSKPRVNADYCGWVAAGSVPGGAGSISAAYAIDWIDDDGAKLASESVIAAELLDTEDHCE